MTASTTAKYADLDLEFVEFRGEEDAEATIQEQGFSADLARFDFFERMSQAVGLRGALKHCGLDVSHDEAESVWDDVKKEIGAAYQRGAARVVAAYGAKPVRGGARPGAGRPPRSVPGVKSQVALDEPLAAWLSEPYAGDLPEALRSTAQAWEALCLAAYPRLRDALSDADLRACLDVANGLILTAGFLGAHLAQDLADHRDPAYRKTASRVARLHRADAAALELWCRAWWAAQEDADQLAVWRRVAGQDHPGPQR